MASALVLTAEELTRFMRYITRDRSGCWLWTGSQTGAGYGKFKARRQTILAHRSAYLTLKGPVSDGLQLDHLCRVRHCVNPEHLEPVTPRVNILRGESIAAANAVKARCGMGHDLAFEANVRLDSKGRRVCRPCQAYWNRQYQARLRAKGA